jgi:formate dehydrogenase major subunit
MTNHYIDLQHADVFLIQGSNAAEHHPMAMKWVLRAQDRGAKIIHVDPRFTRTSSKADVYCRLRSGTDNAFLGGMIKYIIDNNKYFKEYVENYTNALFKVPETYSFDDGLFSGYDPATRKYDVTKWKVHRIGDIPEKATSLDNPESVFQKLKEHYSRYTLEKVSSITGTPVEDLTTVYELYSSTGVRDRAGTIMYALGQTQHTTAVQQIRAMTIVQLLLGNIGICGGGVNALRGEPNVQGSTDFALLYNYLPGYLKAPNDTWQDLATYVSNSFKTSGEPKSVNWLSNSKKYVVSLFKTWFGDSAAASNDFAYAWVPKYDNGVDYSVMTMIDRMLNGGIKGYISVGQDPAVSLPNSNKVRAALKNLDWMIHVNIFDNETASFWKGPGNNPADIKTEVFLLPAAASVEKEGSQSNSGRWQQWKYQAAKPPGDALYTGDIFWKLMLKIRELYDYDVKAGRPVKFPDPILNLQWDYGDDYGKYWDPLKTSKAINGYFLEDKTVGSVDYKKGELVPGFSNLQNDGSTSCAMWVFCGAFTRDGTNLMARRGKEDPTGLGLYPNWSFSWPVNRRIIYNRASVDLDGNPWNPAKPLLKWDSSTAPGKWVGDVVDGGGNPAGQASGKLPFIMKQDGVAALYGPDTLNDGPFPEQYEPLEGPLEQNPMSSQRNSPVIKIFSGDMDQIANASPDYPIVMTTYSCTEHWCSGALTRWQSYLVELQPHAYAEISEELADLKGIQNGDWVTISSVRGHVDCLAVVTKRFKPMTCAGKTVHQMGMTFNGGWLFPEDFGDSANLLSPTVGDPNSMTPEYKAFMVNVKKRDNGS